MKLRLMPLVLMSILASAGCKRETGNTATEDAKRIAELQAEVSRLKRELAQRPGAGRSAPVPDEQTLRSNLARLVQLPLIKDDPWVQATSIAVESVGPFFPNGNKGEVSFRVRWTWPSGQKSEEKWQAELQRAQNGRWYVVQVVLSSGIISKAVRPDMEIK
jgi:hypothetical protein